MRHRTSRSSYFVTIRHAVIISRSQSVIEGVIASVFRHTQNAGPGTKTQAGVHSATRYGRAGHQPTDRTRPKQSAAHAPYGAEPYPASNGAGPPPPRCGAEPYNGSPSNSSAHAEYAPAPLDPGREPQRQPPSRHRRAAEYRRLPHPRPCRAA